MKKEKVSGIYRIENLKNNKNYIGWSVDIYVRWSTHKLELRKDIHTNQYLQRSYNKYGKDNFKFHIIQELERDEEKLKLMEIYWIAYYNSYVGDGNGYNMTRGGDGTLGYVHSEETKKKMSLSQLGDKNHNYGKIASIETREKISANNARWNLGKTHSEETKKKISIANSNISDEKRKRMSLAMLGRPSPMQGRHHSEETKLKLSKLNKNREVSEEIRKKISISGKGRIPWNKGKHHSLESRLKMSKARKGVSNWWRVGAVDSEQTKHKKSESHMGSKNIRAKINEEIVLQIKIMLSNGMRIIDIAKEFPISKDSISKIKRNVTWRHVTI